MERDEVAHAGLEALKQGFRDCREERERRRKEMQEQIDRRFEGVEEDIAAIRVAIEGDGNGHKGLKGAIADLRTDLKLERLRTTAILAVILILVQVFAPVLVHWLERKGP